MWILGQTTLKQFQFPTARSIPCRGPIHKCLLTWSKQTQWCKKWEPAVRIHIKVTAINHEAIKASRGQYPWTQPCSVIRSNQVQWSKKWYVSSQDRNDKINQTLLIHERLGILAKFLSQIFSPHTFTLPTYQKTPRFKKFIFPWGKTILFHSIYGFCYLMLCFMFCHIWMPLFFWFFQFRKFSIWGFGNELMSNDTLVLILILHKRIGLSTENDHKTYVLIQRKRLNNSRWIKRHFPSLLANVI